MFARFRLRLNSVSDGSDMADGSPVEHAWAEPKEPEPEPDDLDWDSYSATLDHRLEAEQQSAQASEQRCVQLEQVRAGLEEQLEEEMACSGQLAMQRDRLQAECNSLRLDMDELEAALTSAEQEKQGSNREVRRLLEVLSLKEDAVEKLQREKEHLAELSQVRP
ncbi:myosin-6-like isoform X1 [Gadus macrocephalus]|uniref:myosin-6-like isoform X1 n=1 Tax=Gadus macrocephalus TaxID=80720 RepID=UPI0028CB26A7|nr:myosin-6-like isoform X1 [Gadus macrocephalus]